MFRELLTKIDNVIISNFNKKNSSPYFYKIQINSSSFFISFEWIKSNVYFQKNQYIVINFSESDISVFVEKNTDFYSEKIH